MNESRRANLTGVSRRPSGWQKVGKEGLEKSSKEVQKELERIQRLFTSLYDSEAGQEFEAMLLDEITRSMGAHRAATTMDKVNYFRGRWDLAEELWSFKRGADIKTALVAAAVDRALKAKEKM